MPRGRKGLDVGKDGAAAAAPISLIGYIVGDYSVKESLAILIVHSHVKKSDFIGRDHIVKELADYGIDENDARHTVKSLVDSGAFQENYHKGTSLRPGFSLIELRAGLDSYAEVALRTALAGSMPTLRAAKPITGQAGWQARAARPSEGAPVIRGEGPLKIEAWRPRGLAPSFSEPARIGPVVTETFSRKKRFASYTSEETGIILQIWAHTSKGEQASKEQVAIELARAGLITEHGTTLIVESLERNSIIVPDESGGIKINPEATVARFAGAWFRVARGAAPAEGSKPA